MAVTDTEFSPFMNAATRISSVDRPALLFDWYFSGRLTGAELAEAVSHAWSSAHLPFKALGMQTWVDLFQAANYTEDGVSADRPATPLTLYRAAPPQYVHRLAWTASLAVAERFLEIHEARYGERPRNIYTVSITDASRILAHITDRQEDEYVVDTRGLKPRRVVMSGMESR